MRNSGCDSYIFRLSIVIALPLFLLLSCKSPVQATSNTKRTEIIETLKIFGYSPTETEINAFVNNYEKSISLSDIYAGAISSNFKKLDASGNETVFAESDFIALLNSIFSSAKLNAQWSGFGKYILGGNWTVSGTVKFRPDQAAMLVYFLLIPPTQPAASKDGRAKADGFNPMQGMMGSYLLTVGAGVAIGLLALSCPLWAPYAVVAGMVAEVALPLLGPSVVATVSNVGENFKKYAVDTATKIVTQTQIEQVAAPTFSPAGGTSATPAPIGDSTCVQISHADPDAQIYYTQYMNSAMKLYAADNIYIYGNQLTVKAMAKKSGMKDSKIATAYYKPATPATTTTIRPATTTTTIRPATTTTTIRPATTTTTIRPATTTTTIRPVVTTTTTTTTVPTQKATMTLSATAAGVDTSSKSYGDTLTLKATMTYSTTNAILSGGNYGTALVIFQCHRLNSSFQYYWPSGQSGDNYATVNLTAKSGTVTVSLKDSGSYGNISDKARLMIVYAPNSNPAWTSGNQVITNEVSISH